MRATLITHYCTHYRVRTYEILAGYEDVTFYFYSAGKEEYWDPSHGLSHGAFRHKYLPGFQVGRTRIAPTLAAELWRNNYDVYIKCVNGKFALPLTYAVARLRRKPFVLWTGIWMRMQTRGHRLAWPLTRFIYHHADAIVTYGTHVNEFLIGEGVRPEKIFAARHAIDNPEYSRAIPEHQTFALRRRLKIDDDQKIVLFVGRLVEVKGLSGLLSAFAQTLDPKAVLVLVGQGPGEPALTEITTCLGIADRVRFAGYVPADQISAYYAIAYVHVLPSVTTRLGRETWGLVVNEAFNQGVPSISSSAVGAAAGGLVVDNETGFVVPEGDTNALSDRLTRILSDRKLRDRLGCGARAKIKSWNNEAMVSAFREAIRYATRKHRSV